MRTTFVRVTAVAMIVGALLVLGGATSAGAIPSTYVCGGGSIPSGSYGSVSIAGLCSVDSGNVTVNGTLTVGPGAGLNAAFGGSDLTVHGDVNVMKNGILVLGCVPESFPCFNDDQQNPTMSTHHQVDGNLTSRNALMMLVHGNTIDGSVVHRGGGGGDTCDNFPLGPYGPPAYSTYEDNFIGGDASIGQLQTCWLGFIRNQVGHDVTFAQNVNNDQDGNEVVSNQVGRNLSCYGNSPAAQEGDSSGAPNVVGGRATGECAALSVHAT